MFDSALGNLNARFTLTIQLYVVLCFLNVLLNRFEDFFAVFIGTESA